MEESVNTKFSGLKIDNHLNWTDIDKLIPKLSGACYAVISATLTLSNQFILPSFSL
jgi:hypothetical protein